MAGNGYGNFLPPQATKEEKEVLSLQATPEDADETSDVSASLFKEMTSEEEMEEVASGGQDQIQMRKERNSNNEMGDADVEGDSSGEEGSLFEEIDVEDESQFPGHRPADQSCFGGTSDSVCGATHGIYGLESGIVEDVPFIRTGQTDLDGPYDVGSLPALGLLREKEVASLDNLGAKMGSIFKKPGAKEESSHLAGISRDYGTSSGEEGGEDAGLVSLADEDSTLGGAQNPYNELRDSVWPGKDATMGLVGDKLLLENTAISPSSVQHISSPSGPDPGAHEVVNGVDKPVTSGSSKERVRKRGRATRELGALLMDANAGRLGKRAFGLQGACTQASGLTALGESADACATSDGVGLSSLGPCSTGEVRVTRSQASGRSVVKDEKVDAKVFESRGPSDVAAKRTGKRSVTRGARLGWGNGNELSQQTAEEVRKVEESISVLDEVLPEVQLVAAASPPNLQCHGEIPKSKSKGKSGNWAKTTRVQGRSGYTEDFPGPDSKEIPPSNLEGTSTYQAAEMETHMEKVLDPASSSKGSLQEVVCSLNSQETEILDVGKVAENSSTGRRRSNRQAAKVGEKIERGQVNSNGRLPKGQPKGRRKASSGGGKTSEEVLNDNTHGKEDSQNIEEVGDLVNASAVSAIEAAGTSNSVQPRGKGRRAAKGKKNVEIVSTGRGKKGPSVSGRPPNVGKGSGRAGPKSNQSQGQLTPANMESASCVEDTTLTGDDNACANEKSDKNASRLRSYAKEDSQDNIEGSQFEGPPIDLLRDDHCAILDDSDASLRKVEICNSSPCVNLLEQVSKGSKTLGRSRLAMKIEGSSQEDATVGGTEGSQERAAGNKKDKAHQNDDGNTVADGSRDSRDDAGSATSFESLIKKEDMEPNKGLQLDLFVPANEESGDPLATGAANAGEHAEVTGAGKARIRQRPVNQQQNRSLLSAKLGKKGKKGAKIIDHSKAVGLVVLQEKKLTVVAKKKATVVKKKREKRKATVETSAMDVAEINERIAIAEPSELAGVTDATESLVHSEGSEEMPGKQASNGHDEKHASSRLQLDVSKRRKLGKLAEGCLTVNSSSTLDVPVENQKDPGESSCVNGAKPSRQVKGGQKKSKKSLTPAPDVNETKNESRRASRAKGTTIKALSSIKDQASEKAPGSVEVESANIDNGNEMFSPEASPLQPEVLGGAKRGGAKRGRDVEVTTKPLDEQNLKPGSGSPEAVVELDKPPQLLETHSGFEDTGAVGEDMSSGVTEGDGNEESERRVDPAAAEAGVTRKSWVLCDDCNKWRCIPVELADQIDDTNAKWSCRDNPNPDFADCSIPQEKSNAEINEELQISEASLSDEGDDKDGIESKLMEIGTASGDNKPAVWKLIRRNIFQHRRKKAQGTDEIMVCQCTSPEDGEVGCGENCLNRVLNIECVQEHCPCGNACSNQQFQKRMYAPVATFRCGKKGFGLKVLKHTPKDTFLIEYVGEVLDVGAFEKRQLDYARNGQKHFYFMTLSSTEVIDACSKGNLGRFINHSCEPNCKTEKWMVNGEVCIGLFAVRDIAEGEEVTFDYNYVRVRGASAKKCECGSSQCRGFIGADSETPRAVVESDSEDEEDPEPIMLENSDEEDTHVDENKSAPPKKLKADGAYRESTSTRSSRIKRKLVSLKEKSPTPVKRVKISNTSKKSGPLTHKGLMVDVGGGRHEGGRALASDVQEKLDDLLDEMGGLRKRKDVAAQYLKLLVLAVASGDNKKDASACSVRDISLLLEALLRTSSRSVLSDIMKMNGLRMLHHLIKQLRKQWIKTPILRKLMKVLELLTTARVLTVNMINSAAPCQGMESFSESLFELTRHKDQKVCQMARRFRNNWVPPRPQGYEQHNKGVEKLSQGPPNPISPVQVHPSNQMQIDNNQFVTSQKHSPNAAVLKDTEEPKALGSSSVLPGSQNQSGSQILDEKITSASTLEDVSMQKSSGTGAGNVEKVKRKRVSRWDAPAKVEKGTYEAIVVTSPADVQATESSTVGRQTPAPSAPQMQPLSAQFSFQGPREFNKKQRHSGPSHQNGRALPFRYDAPVGSASSTEASEDKLGTPSGQPAGMPLQHAWQASWPSGTSSGLQEPTRLPFSIPSGPPQLHPGCAPPGIAQRRSEPGFNLPVQPLVPQAPGPLSAPPAMQIGGPPQQVSSANVGHHGGVPLPASVYPGCPPAQIGLGGPPLHVLHGVPPSMPIGFPQSMHYGHWGPAPGVPPFPGPPTYTMDESRRYVPQGTWALNTSLFNEDGSQRTSIGGEGLSLNGQVRANDARIAGDMEPEPPVPGLSPPKVASSVTCDSSAVTHACPREFSQQMMPPEFVDTRRCGERFLPTEVSDMRREREYTHDHCRGGAPDTRDTGGGFHEEQWDDPESQSFRDHVFFLVRSRVRRHSKLRSRDTDKFCTKLADVIVRKEVAKCLEYRNQGSEKIIVRSKLVEKVESYVDNQVEQFSRKFDRSYKSGDSAR